MKSYPENTKIDAVKLWLVTGNLTTTAAALKIPYDTVKTWRYSKWWEDLAVEVRSEGRLELSARLKKIAEKALGETLDRLENGDFRLSPTGQVERVPVPASVASKIATDFIDRAESLDKAPQEQNSQSVNERLKALAEAFTKFSGKVRRIEIEDIEDDDRVQSLPLVWDAESGSASGGTSN